MPTVSLNGLSISDLAWPFNLLPIRHMGPAHSILSHLQLHFIYQHMVTYNDKD
jgi:hypothetical protein